MAEVHDEKTLRKVYMGLAAAGVFGQTATDAVFQMQNQGVLFRERCVCGEDSGATHHRTDGPCYAMEVVHDG